MKELLSYKHLMSEAQKRYPDMFATAMRMISSEDGASMVGGMAILGALIGVVVVLVVMSEAIPVLWPIAANSTAIADMTGTDAGTTTMQAFWPIVLLLVGLGVAVGLIVFALKRFNLLT